MNGPKQISNEEWLGLGHKLFGPDMAKWKFKCVNCGHVQCGEDFRKLGVKNIDQVVFYSCIGRWMPESKGDWNNKKQPCNWTLGGLFKLHKLEVIQPNGKTIPVFEFAEEGQ